MYGAVSTHIVPNHYSERYSSLSGTNHQTGSTLCPVPVQRYSPYIKTPKPSPPSPNLTKPPLFETDLSRALALYTGRGYKLQGGGCWATARTLAT